MTPNLLKNPEQLFVLEVGDHCFVGDQEMVLNKAPNGKVYLTTAASDKATFASLYEHAMHEQKHGGNPVFPNYGDYIQHVRASTTIHSVRRNVAVMPRDTLFEALRQQIFTIS
jgi:hypothetical protein